MIEQWLRYGELDIPYKVFFVSGRKHKVAIHVHPNGTVQVDAPTHTPLAEIKQAVGKRSRWLCNHLGRINEQYVQVLPREYVSGECHFYMGRRYVLKFKNTERQKLGVKLKQGQLQVATTNTRRCYVKSLLWAWYIDHARKIFEHKLDALWAEASWVQKKPDWKLLTMKKQWGSCSPGGVLSLNPHLVKAPSKCIDYVLLHELCHLKFHNHSPNFYRLLNKQMPEWEAVKGRLDGMAELLLNY